MKEIDVKYFEVRRDNSERGKEIRFSVEPTNAYKVSRSFLKRGKDILLKTNESILLIEQVIGYEFIELNNEYMTLAIPRNDFLKYIWAENKEQISKEKL